MADAPPPPPPKRPPPRYSSISPGNLGLKVGYWDGTETHPVEFRDIVGWVVVVNAIDANVVPFQPVVLNDFGAPAFAVNLIGYIGVFALASTPDEARQKYALWQPKAGGSPEGAQSGLN